MRQSGNPCSRLERTLGFAVLLCLATIAGGVYRAQFSLNPAVAVSRTLALQPDQRIVSTAPAGVGIASLPPELRSLGPLESFSPDNLYDKIDGKAELYLAAGFERLQCQRFALTAAEEQWLEWFVYDMGTMPQAFSVFSTQRRAEGEDFDLTAYAYKTRNALYFVAGHNYVEAIASSPDTTLMRAAIELAQRFVAANPDATASLPEFEFFPRENLVPHSQTLQSTDAFGFDRFKNVFTAQYRVSDAEVLAFVTSCSDASAAAALGDAYRSFLLANGGKELAAQGPADFGRPIEIMGTLELVFARGHLVAGVRSAPSVPVALELARRLDARIAEKTR